MEQLPDNRPASESAGASAAENASAGTVRRFFGRISQKITERRAAGKTVYADQPGHRAAVACFAFGAFAFIFAFTIRAGLVCGVLSALFARKAVRLGVDRTTTRLCRFAAVGSIAAGVFGAVSFVLTVRKLFRIVSCTAENALQYTSDPDGYVEGLEQTARMWLERLRSLVSCA